MARRTDKRTEPALGTAGRILFVDDEPDAVEPLMAAARGLGFDALLLESGGAFAATLDTFAPTHVVIDLVMPEVDGIELLLALARRPRRPRILVMTGYHWGVMESARILAEAHQLSEIGWLRKPVDLDEFEGHLTARVVT
ncbi:MAG: response regulator [Alphaproteobacteria bacterium]